MLLKLISKAQVEGLVRAAGAALGGYLIGKGVDASLVNDLIGAGGIAVMAIWSYLSKK